MKALIVEDELIVASHLKTILQKNGVEVTGIAANISEALKYIDKEPDMVLLDIHLSDNETGITIGTILTQKGIPFIYVTANNDALTLREAINTNPVSYLTKPFKDRDVTALLELVRLRLNARPYIKIETPQSDIKLLLDAILYIEAAGSYVSIVTADTTYIKRITLKDIEPLLDARFTRIHRSYIVNNDRVSYRTASAVFIGSVKIAVSRTFRDGV